MKMLQSMELLTFTLNTEKATIRIAGNKANQSIRKLFKISLSMLLSTKLNGWVKEKKVYRMIEIINGMTDEETIFRILVKIFVSVKFATKLALEDMGEHLSPK